jgi:hypothetical protein
MNIIEFLDEVGHTKLRFQFLHGCLRGAKSIMRGKAVEVSFATNEFAVSDVINPTKVGIVVWMDREDFERVQDQISKK